MNPSLNTLRLCYQLLVDRPISLAADDAEIEACLVAKRELTAAIKRMEAPNREDRRAARVGNGRPAA